MEETLLKIFRLNSLSEKKNVIFFFYPLDFTFVCPTEILAFQERLADFEARETAVVGCSVDSHQSHWAWLNTPKDQGGIRGDLSDCIGFIQNHLDELRGTCWRL